MSTGKRYHISPKTGRPNICSAQGKCPLPGNPPHFTSKEEARQHLEERYAHRALSTVKKAAKKAPALAQEASAGGGAPKRRGRPPKKTQAEAPSTPEVPPEEEAPQTFMAEEDLALSEEIDLEEDIFAEDEVSSEDGCEDCGEDDASVRFRKDPYHQRVHGETLYRNLCTDCYERLQDDF